jgi:hypothetical protein
MVIHVSLNGQNNSTMVTITVRGLSFEQDWAGMVDFLERTWGRVLNNLKTVLETKPQS